MAYMNFYRCCLKNLLKILFLFIRRHISKRIKLLMKVSSYGYILLLYDKKYYSEVKLSYYTIKRAIFVCSYSSRKRLERFSRNLVLKGIWALQIDWARSHFPQKSPKA